MTTDQPLKRRIESRAPTRIDLAGGTVDIWPLYLFLNEPTTLNVGVNLFAEARIEEYEATSETSDASGQIVLKSEDQGAEMRLDWATLDKAVAPPSLVLHLKLLKSFVQRRIKAGCHDPRLGFSLTTIARSPAGAGLGGSSALSVALVGALVCWSRSTAESKASIDTLAEGEKWINIVRDIETTVIQVPAGLQDYYGAMFGGLQSLRWRPGAHERDWFPGELLASVEHRILLFYSGQSRNSGINNWALFKAFIDKQENVRERFQQITDATNALDTALRDRNWDDAAEAISREWDVRRTLAQGISTPEMDQAFSVAKREGVPSGKVCGAGGGGCFFLFVPSGDPELKARIVKKLGGMGIRQLPFRAVTRGLEVRVTVARA